MIPPVRAVERARHRCVDDAAAHVARPARLRAALLALCVACLRRAATPSLAAVGTPPAAHRRLCCVWGLGCWATGLRDRWWTGGRGAPPRHLAPLRGAAAPRAPPFPAAVLGTHPCPGPYHADAEVRTESQLRRDARLLERKRVPAEVRAQLRGLRPPPRLDQGRDHGCAGRPRRHPQLGDHPARGQAGGDAALAARRIVPRPLLRERHVQSHLLPHVASGVPRHHEAPYPSGSDYSCSAAAGAVPCVYPSFSGRTRRMGTQASPKVPRARSQRKHGLCAL
eukprot:scaffold84547_cov98-Phaeocystis_antarctica.AAC.4